MTLLLYPRLNLKSEADRYRTFETWRVPFMDKHKLAAAGFYFINRDDLVKCAFCGVELGRWEEGDDPLTDHRKWRPSCPFLLNLPVGNIPLSNNYLPARVVPRSNDVCGVYDPGVRPHATDENAVGIIVNEEMLEQLGINEMRGPSYPMYVAAAVRLKSFSSWPISLKQRPEKLSEAGFFYTGRSDKTLCFYCGGGLKDWEDTDDPWIEHAKHFSKCLYVILIKGRAFVASAVEEHENASLTKAVESLQITEGQKSSLKVRNTVEFASAGSSVEPIPSTSSGSLGDDAYICKICVQEELCVVFLPCGHLISCAKCAPTFQVCAICRQKISATVKVFLS